jgi:hypothetical protein
MIMTFSTDAHWPHGLLDIFDISRNENAPLESRYCGPYDRLFNYAMKTPSTSSLPRNLPR